MNIEVVAIGNEILAGHIVNTNAAYISQQLLKEGYRVTRHTVMPDDRDCLYQGLKEALQRNQFVITTGGLGPTCDDVSRNVAAELFESDFIYNEEIAADLLHRYGNSLPTLENQATVPRKATLLKNSAGTAPGLIFKSEKTSLIMLPGVPGEMRAMFGQVLEYLKKDVIEKTHLFSKHLQLFNICEATPDVILRQLMIEFPNVEFGIYPAQGTLRINLSVASSEEIVAEKILNLPYQRIATEFAPFLYEAPSGKLEEAILQRFVQKKLTLSAAESCTGGSLSAHLTQIPGASQYFLGAIVAYSNTQKIQLLGVPEQLIREKGAVSAEVVTAMLKGLLERTGSDYGVAVSGIAGPTGGTPEKPVGTIWNAAGRKGEKPHIWQIKAIGSREMIIEKSINALLSELLILTKP